jgi:hypothetical protein
MKREAVARLVSFPLKAREAQKTLWVHHAIAAAPSEAGQETQQTGALAWAQNKVLDLANKQLTSLKEAAPDSVRGYAYKGILYVLDRVDPDEVALRHLGSAKDVEVLLPEAGAQQTPADALARLKQLATERDELHRQWFRVSVTGACVVPLESNRFLWRSPGSCSPSHPPRLSQGLFITVPLAVLPVPSVPVYYNLFRLWSNHRAVSGAGSLRYALDASHIPTDLQPCTGPLADGCCCRAAAAWKGAPSHTRAVVVPWSVLGFAATGLGGPGPDRAVAPADALQRAHAVEERLACLSGLTAHVRHVLRHHHQLIGKLPPATSATRPPRTSLPQASGTGTR